jgi:elongation of very long chain fatty acids protein 4
MPTVLYTVLYLAIVRAGPRLMKNRQPFRLTWALIPYNLSMAALNFYIASEVSGRMFTAKQPYNS